MNKALGILVILAVIAAPSMAQQVTIDYAHDFDFEPVKTFTFVAPTDQAAGNDLTDDRLESAIIRELTQSEGGLKQVDSNPDLYITYHVTSKDNTTFQTSSYGYGGYGAGWGGYGRYGYGAGYGIGSMDTTTRAYTYTEGTLIIDAYDPTDKKLVWRGTGTVTLKSKPEKQAKQVDNILTKMGKQWQKILKNQGQ